MSTPITINPYLSFKGDCKAAFELYHKALGGKIIAMLSYADTPMVEGIPPEDQGKIVHACLDVGGQLIMGGDPVGPGCGTQSEGGMGSSVNITVNDPAEATRIFKTLSEGGTVRMPLEKTFWAELFGMWEDRFGISWMINCDIKS